MITPFMFCVGVGVGILISLTYFGAATESRGQRASKLLDNRSLVEMVKRERKTDD